MSIAVNIGAIIRQAVEHVEVHSITIAAVVEPIAAAGMMIGVEAAILVTNRDAEPDYVTRDRIRQLINRSSAISACLKAITIARPFKFRREAVIHGPAVLESYRLVRPETV